MNGIDEFNTGVTVAASYNPDGWCTAITVSMNYQNVTHDDIAETVRALVKPRRPRPSSDVADTQVLYNPGR